MSRSFISAVLIIITSCGMAYQCHTNFKEYNDEFTGRYSVSASLGNNLFIVQDNETEDSFYLQSLYDLKENHSYNMDSLYVVGEYTNDIDGTMPLLIDNSFLI